MSVARSGPFFVVDKQGRPLMPFDSQQAYNRLRRADQQMLEHHAFTVFQLDRVIVKPKLRAVMLAVLPHPEVVDMYIVVEAQRSEHSLLRVVVDVSRAATSLEEWRNPLTRKLLPDPKSYAAAIADVVEALQRFLPLSHALLPLHQLADPHVGSLTAEAQWERAALNWLIIYLAKRGLDFCARPPRGHSKRWRSRALVKAMTDFIAQPDDAPVVIARHGVWPYWPLVEHQSLLMPPDWSNYQGDTASSDLRFHRGEILYSVTLDNGRTLPGIYDGKQPDGQSLILLPHIVFPLYIRWQHVSSASVQCVPRSADDLVRFFRPYPA